MASVIHSSVVDALKVFVEVHAGPGKVFNTQKIDLALERKGAISMIFEVKTSSDTQSVYTAVGQLFMHSVGLPSAAKMIVLPGAGVSAELEEFLSALGISVLRFVPHGDSFSFELPQGICWPV